MDGDERAIVGVTMLAHGMVHTYELSIPILIPVWLDQFATTPSVIGIVVGAGYALFGFLGLVGGAATLAALSVYRRS